MRALVILLAALLAVSCAIAIEGRIAVGDDVQPARTVTPCPSQENTP